jgi:DNA-binding NarL/FixJ family response regulator
MDIERVKMSEIIYVTENGKKRKATAEEIAQIKKDQAEAAERERLIEAAEKEKIEKRESAVSKLKAIGLTDDEIAALIP